MRLSKKQLATLRRIKKYGPASALSLRCSISTIIALERRKLVKVDTTFENLAFPRKALAHITDAGKVAAFQL